MGTEILKSFSSLQSELEQAKSSLKGVDENIKRLIGRDPSEPPLRAGVKRGPTGDDKQRNRNGRRNYGHEMEEPPVKRRVSSGVSVFKRLSDRPVPEPALQKQMISKVIVTNKEVPSRQEALAAQSKDEKSKARNRRMFGALLGTLQKFQQEETKLKHKEDKRAQLEKKIEEHEIKEKQEIKKERQELFLNRRKKQAEIKVIELKMMRMKEYSYWEEKQRPRGNFITTKAKPHIQFLPRRLNDTAKAQLASCRENIEKMIEKKRNDVLEELKQIEERMKRNFEQQKSGKDNENNETIENEGEQHLDESLATDVVEDSTQNEPQDIDNSRTVDSDIKTDHPEETTNGAKEIEEASAPVEESQSPNETEINVSEETMITDKLSEENV